MDVTGHPYPASLQVDTPERMARWRPLLQWLLAIPHLIALLFVGFVATLAHVVGFFAVLITGRWPESLRNLVVGFFRWTLRVNAYHMLLTDRYPPFSLQ